MKSLARYLVMLVVAALLVAAPGAAFAQEGADPLCNGLTDADCELLSGASTAMEGVTAFNVPSFSIDFFLNSTEGETLFNATGSASFMLPAEMDMAAADSMMAHVMVDAASYSSPSSSDSVGPLEILLVGDMVYINWDGEWYGGSTTEEADGMDDMGGTSTMGDIDEITSMFDDFDMNLAGVLTTTRGADGDAMGQPTATFTTNADISALLVALLSSPTVTGALGGDASETGETEMTPEDMQMIGAMIAPMFEGTTIAFTQEVGTEDNMVHGVALDVLLNADLSLFVPEVGAVVGELHFAADLADFNGTFDFTAPESYRPLEELEEMDAMGM